MSGISDAGSSSVAPASADRELAPGSPRSRESVRP